MSAATVHSEIRAAGRQALLAIAGLPAMKHWEGSPFSETLGTPYVREQCNPISSLVRSVGASGASGRTVAHTVALNYSPTFPPGAGTLPLEQAVGLIMAAFQAGGHISYGATSAYVVQCERSGLRQEPDWLSCTVTVTVVAYTFD